MTEHPSFDDRAATWDEQPGRRERLENAARLIADAVAGDDVHDMLEVGAGTGMLSFLLSERLPGEQHVTITDTSAGMRAVAQQRVDEAGNGWEVSDLDLATVPASELEPRYDLVYSHMVLHHVEDVSAMFSAFRRVLRPGGALVVLDLVPDGGKYHAPREGHGHPFHHHDGFSEAELRSFTAKAGFTDVQHSVPSAVTITRDGREREFPLFLLLAR